MTAELKRRSLVLLAVAYFLASQATVVCIVSEWYSTGGETAVAWQSGPARDNAGLSWTPRTHLLLDEQGNLSAAEIPAMFSYPPERSFHVIWCDQLPLSQSDSYFAPLSNKAPPQV